MRKPGHQYADDYPDPLTGHPLQTYPIKELEEFDSVEDWAAYQDAVARWTNYLPPKRPWRARGHDGADPDRAGASRSGGPSVTT